MSTKLVHTNRGNNSEQRTSNPQHNTGEEYKGRRGSEWVRACENHAQRLQEGASSSPRDKNQGGRDRCQVNVREVRQHRQPKFRGSSHKKLFLTVLTNQVKVVELRRRGPSCRQARAPSPPR